MADQSLLALGLTCLAGLSTGIGSLIGLSSRRFSSQFLTLSLGFSAGAMVYVSLVEILPKARLSLEPLLGLRLGYASTVLAFFAGIVLMGLVDAMISSNMTLLDVQWLTPHLQSLGVIELPRTAYLDRLSQAISP